MGRAFFILLYMLKMSAFSIVLATFALICVNDSLENAVRHGKPYDICCIPDTAHENYM